jgi:hypothetical protein
MPPRGINYFVVVHHVLVLEDLRTRSSHVGLACIYSLAPPVPDRQHDRWGNHPCEKDKRMAFHAHETTKTCRNGKQSLVVLVVVGVTITIINALRLRLAFLVEMTPWHVRLVPPEKLLILSAHILANGGRGTYASFPRPFSPLLPTGFRIDLRSNSGV